LIGDLFEQQRHAAVVLGEEQDAPQRTVESGGECLRFHASTLLARPIPNQACGRGLRHVKLAVFVTVITRDRYVKRVLRCLLSRDRNAIVIYVK
jgi:hypothetical protein